MKTEHILIIRLSAFGDVAMTVPVVASLARQYPDLRITVLSLPFTRALFDNLAPNVGFMGADVRNEYRGIGGLNALYRRLVAKNFTAVADLHDVLRSRYLTLRFRMGQYRVATINKHRSGKRALTRKEGKVMEQQPSSFSNYADVLERLGYPVTLEFTSIFGPEGGPLRSIPEALAGEKRAFQQWIGVAPSAAHGGKVYPADLTQQAIALVLKRHPSCRIFLFGGRGKEGEELARWAEQDARITSVAGGLLTLEQELILMSHLDVMVSMDSANMHLASLTATPVVSIWGATHPLAGFMGWQQPERYAVQVDLPCRPCSTFGDKPCHRGDYACLRGIEPSAVADRVDLVLAER